mmetsp:Transcript_25733/g.64826  ORF Transcript_25733/g.64826 Transcript_25733/m.64826 type:complete len:205 (+) Transcript_25733:2796-3410(+)
MNMIFSFLVCVFEGIRHVQYIVNNGAHGTVDGKEDIVYQFLSLFFFFFDHHSNVLFILRRCPVANPPEAHLQHFPVQNLSLQVSHFALGSSKSFLLRGKFDEGKVEKFTVSKCTDPQRTRRSGDFFPRPLESIQVEGLTCFKEHIQQKTCLHVHFKHARGRRFSFLGRSAAVHEHCFVVILRIFQFLRELQQPLLVLGVHGSDV